MTINGFKLLELKEKEIEKLYGKHTSIKITQLLSTAKKEMCINDIEFIESVLETNNFDEPQEPDPDTNDSLKISAVDKIVYLEELGIIDFLRHNAIGGISNVQLGHVLSKITSEIASTLSTNLNKLPKDPKIDNKHPYYSEKKVNKIKEKLKDWGFKPKS